MIVTGMILIALILAGKVMIQQPCLIYFMFFIKNCKDLGML